LRTGKALDLLGVSLEEDVEQAPAKTVGDPVLERPFRFTGEQLRPNITQNTYGAREEAEIAEGVPRFERAGKRLSMVVYA
jgi:hypothetical protein